MKASSSIEIVPDSVFLVGKGKNAYHLKISYNIIVLSIDAVPPNFCAITRSNLSRDISVDVSLLAF
jgi:hypothetical protein